MSIQPSAFHAAASPALLGIFPQGAAPTDAAQITDAVVTHGLLDSLREGNVYVGLQDIPESLLPRFNTLSLLPVNHMKLYATMLNVDDWADWMPRFQTSERKGPWSMGQKIQEAKTGTEIRMFHYRALVQNREIPGGEQIVWNLDGSGDFTPDSGTTGLRVNNGSWTFTATPEDRNQTLMAYQIHVVPDILDFFVASARLLIEKVTMNEFHGVIQAMANRTLDPSWTPRSPQNPSGMSYKIQKVG